MSIGEIVLAVFVGLFAVAFGLWARRLDKALDVLEELQTAWFKHALSMETRMTRVETHVGLYHFNKGEENG